MSDQKSYSRACVGCIYMGWIAGYLGCCNYYLVTGKRRPCPPGQGCSVKQKSKRAKGAETGKEIG